MEPKMEQPKQYTPEEIAQLEKSRTISDAELLKGGAEYVVSEKGEKENLLVTEEQFRKLHKQMSDDLWQKEFEAGAQVREAMGKEQVEAKKIVGELFIDEVVAFLKKDSEDYPDDWEMLDWSKPETSKRNKQWREFLLDLEKKIAAKVAELPEEKRLLAEKIQLHSSGDVEGRFVCPACIWFAMKEKSELNPQGKGTSKLEQKIAW